METLEGSSAVRDSGASKPVTSQSQLILHGARLWRPSPFRGLRRLQAFGTHLKSSIPNYQRIAPAAAG